MSVFSDLFEGNFGNIGTDFSHTFSSLASHPDELAETAGATALIGGGLLGAGLLGADAGIAGADVAAGADFGAGATDLTGTVAGSAALDPALAATGFDITGAGLGADVLADPAIAGFASADALSLAGDSALSLGGDATAAFAPVSDAFAANDFGVAASGIDDTTAAAWGAGAQDISGVATDPFSQTATATQAATPTATAAPAELGGQAGTAPAASQAVTAASPSGGGITDTLGAALKSPWTRLAAGVAPLGLALARGQSGLPPQAGQAGAIAGQVGQQGVTDLANARTGILNQGQIASLGIMQQDLLNKWRQTMFNQGVQDPTKDSRWPQIQAVIDQQITAATQTMIQQNIQNALAETGQASGTLTNIARLQMESDQNFTNTLVNATKALGTAVGGSTITLKAA